ncbi:10573_t:CDS:1 [Diversispora eburnea]|uniref:10573_t:CDS:1 n=1 Tax=Diversispora eburnea TaxID=1213867 RepID=A0A9N9FER0_9GLOM|nr:10573_t:CDS:1 [Diversispora eburnea]
MSSLINLQVPFPPSTNADEIVELHLEKGVNQTMNAFMIYRKEFNRIVTNYNLELKDISKYAGISWKNETEDVKDYYRQMAKKVKKIFKEKRPFRFIHNKQESCTKDLMTIDDDEFMKYLPYDLSETYRAIIQSLLV